MWLQLVLASALLPGQAECSAGAGAPRWSHQKKREVSGQQQRSRECRCGGCTPAAPCVSTGCAAVTGPGTVQGFLGGSLSVTCTYPPGWEKLPKYWCIPSSLFFYTCGTDIVITSESQPEVLRGRFSIRDNRTNRAFTVTVDGLFEEDAGTFLCGVQTERFVRDESADVKVIVLPETRGPSGTRCIPPSTVSATPTLSPDAPQGTRGTFRHFSVLAGLQLLALLAMSAAVLWVSPRGR
ncbi:unnamed protein product [Coccothraustes coccothraustes]